MKLILVEAPKAGILWVAEENGNLDNSKRRAVYGDHRKLKTITKEELNGPLDVDMVTLLRVRFGLIAPSDTNWSQARDAIAQISDANNLVIGMKRNMKSLLEGNR